MDNQPAPSVIRSTSRPAFLIPVFFLLTGFILGLIAGPAVNLPSIITQKQSARLTKTPSTQTNESNLPISLALLHSPLVYEWRGSIKGKLTKKEPHNFMVTDDKGDSINLTDLLPTGEKWQTIYIDTKTNKFISSQDIATGSAVMADFFVFKAYPNVPVVSSIAKE